MNAVTEPIDIGVDLAPECEVLRRLATAILTGWTVPDFEAECILDTVEGIRGELMRRCARPARVRMELSQTWPVVTLVMACGDVVAVEYFDVSGFLLGMSSRPMTAAR